MTEGSNYNPSVAFNKELELAGIDAAIERGGDVDQWVEEQFHEDERW